MGKKSPIWAAFRVKRLENGNRRSYCTLKTGDGKECDYYYDQKEKDFGTSTLISHVNTKHAKDFNRIMKKDNDNKPVQKQMTEFAKTEEELQQKADLEIIEYIARRNETFSVVDDEFFRSKLVQTYGANFVKKINYYRTTGLQNASNYWKNKVKDLIKDKELACSTDLWSNLSSDFCLMVVTATYFEGWKRENIILTCRSIEKPHNAEKIQEILVETFYDLDIEMKNVVFITRDDGSDVKKACQDLSKTSAQCGPHAFNNVIQSAFEGDPEKDLLPMLKKKAQNLASSFCKKAVRRRKLGQAQNKHGLKLKRIRRIFVVRWNSIYLCFKDILYNERALLELLFDSYEIYLQRDDFKSVREAAEILKYFYEKTLELSKRSSIISEIIPAFKKLQNWINQYALKSSKFQCSTSRLLLIKLSSELGRKIEAYGRNRYIASAMALDPRYHRNQNYFSEAQWQSAENNILNFLTQTEVEDFLAEDVFDTTSNNSLNSNNSSDIDPDALDERQRIKSKCDRTDIREEIKREFEYLHQHVDSKMNPMEFYEKNEHGVPNLSKAAKHFFLASSSSVESESFFSDATALYANKQRNRLSAESAQKLLEIRVMQKRNISNTENVEKNPDESDESDSDEEF